MNTRCLAYLAVVLVHQLLLGCGTEQMHADQSRSGDVQDSDAMAEESADSQPKSSKRKKPISQEQIAPSVISEDVPPPVGNELEPVAEVPPPVAEKDPDEVVDKPAETDDPRYSKGTGGAGGLVEQTFQASNGLSSSYKMMVPADAGLTKPYGLHIHLHGDGGGGYRDFPNKETRDNLIGVTVKAPNQNMTWGRAAGVTHGQYLQDLIQNELVKKYNVDLKRIYFSGVSGGAYFLSGNFIPTYGKFYRSGAFLMCGGEAPRVAFDEAEFLKEFIVYWQVTAGERNDILRSVRQSIAAFKNALDAAGGTAEFQGNEIVGNGGHCEFDGNSYTTGIQYMMDLKFSVALKKEPAAPSAGDAAKE